MTSREIKETLAYKLRNEGWTGNIESLISVRKDKDATWITIKDYEHIQFKLTQEIDNYFGKIVQVFEYWRDGDKLEQGDCISFVDSKREYKVEEALLQLGYHIGTTF